MVPETATYVVPKPGTRTAKAVTPEALISAYGGDIEKAIKALEALKK